MQTDPEVDVDDDAIFKDPKPANQLTRGRGSNRKGRARGSARKGVQPLYSVRPPSGRGLL